MIVGDEVDTLRVLENGLKNSGFNVVSFSDPTEALQHFQGSRESIAMVITDARMPKMSGFQLARMLKQLRQDVRIILMSAFEISKREFEKVLPSTHIDGFLTKPFQISELMETFNKV